ncbi:MAG: integrase core domain-containing protein, partial [Dermatophilaceae bacterium]
DHGRRQRLAGQGGNISFRSRQPIFFGAVPRRAGCARVRPSMGRTGVCWDNALAESFFGALKTECVHRFTFPTLRHACTAIANYIETFNNRRRIHSRLGYRTPQQVETEHYSLGLAA